MTSKAFKGYRTAPVQDGSARVKLERVPYFGAKDKSAKIRQRKSKKVRVVQGGFAALFTPVKDGKV